MPGLGIDAESGVEVLAGTLFASALLTRNFSESPQAFWVSLYHAVKLSQVRSLPELWNVCNELLGKK